jgi:hypothetical protein
MEWLGIALEELFPVYCQTLQITTGLFVRIAKNYPALCAGLKKQKDIDLR